MQIFGNKTVALFDLWSIEHLVSGMATVIVVEFLCKKFLPELYDSKMVSEKNRKIMLLISFAVLIFLWEALEFYLEAGYTHNEHVTYWFQGVEYWGNRLITDPVITLIGAYIGLSYRKITLPARVFSITWLLVHVFVFPHCMYLQDKYF